MNKEDYYLYFDYRLGLCFKPKKRMWTSSYITIFALSDSV